MPRQSRCKPKGKGKEALHAIWQADTRKNAESAFDAPSAAFGAGQNARRVVYPGMACCT